MCGQDGFLPFCLACGVDTLQEQGETWALVEGQGRLAPHGETGEEQVILMVQNKRLSGSLGGHLLQTSKLL